MKWIEPHYSKKKVNKAGRFFVLSKSHDENLDDHLAVFFNWRDAHAFPMQILLDFLRKNAIRIDPNALVVQRLKRWQSIMQKLIRQQHMSLSRMEDIAGCRAVLSTNDDVQLLYHKLRQSRTKNILHRERDYISHPKSSGYRGIHLIYKYNGRKEKYKGLFVELQIRSKIQHSWATAVEVTGTFTKQALKASSGDDIWLDFFKLTSIEFAKLENFNVHTTNEKNNTLHQLKKIVVKLEIYKRLRAFNVIVQTISNRTSGGSQYFLLLLDLERRVINLRSFKKSQLDEATQQYNSDEEKFRDDETKDLVLVAADSMRKLKQAYPNYFSDTQDFLINLDKVINRPQF